MNMFHRTAQTDIFAMDELKRELPGTAASYLLDSTRPWIDTEFGRVQKGSSNYYQVLFDGKNIP